VSEDASGRYTDDTDRERRRMMKNPKTGKRVDINSLPETGYKRAYLELLAEFEEYKGRIQNAVELNGTLNFDKDKWELKEAKGSYRLHQTERDEEGLMELVAFTYPTPRNPHPEPIFSDEGGER